MKKRIIDCTIDQFETIGLRKFTMDLIAAKLRISKRTLYLYFSSKEQLIEVCLKEWLHRKRLLEQNGETLIDDLCALYFGIQKIDLQRVACCCRELRQCYISVYQLIGKHGQTDPVRTVQIDPFKTVETDPVKTEQTDPPLGLDIKVAFGRFLGNRILLA